MEIRYTEKVELLPDGKKQFFWNKCDLFTPAEVEDIYKASVVIERLFENLFRLDAARDAFREFENDLKALSSNDPFAIATVDRRLRSYLFEWKLFLEHWKKYIDDGAQTVYWTDKTGSDKYVKAYQKYYTDVTNAAYDSCPEYVLATAIRNHVAHAQKAINSYDICPTGNYVYISRDALLKGLRKGKTQEETIKRQPTLIDLYVVAKKSLEAAEKVMGQLMDFQIDNEYVSAAIILLKAKSQIDEAGIVSEHWMIRKMGEVRLEQAQTVQLQRVKDGKGNPVNDKPIELPLMVETVDMLYQSLNWKGYLAFASIVVHKFESGEWKKVQEKYLSEV